MQRMWMVSAALLISAAGANAAVVESFAGTVSLSVSGSVMPLADPRADLTESMVYDGTRRHEASVPGGGSAAVAYRAVDTADGAMFDICAWTALNLDVPPAESLSTARVDMSFTTTQDLNFTMTAKADHAYYEAVFGSFTASLLPDLSAPGGLGGTIGTERTITFSGLLAAGQHTLAMFTTPAGPRGPIEANYCQWTLTLSAPDPSPALADAGEVHMNPTPSAVMAGVVLLGAVVLPRRGRRG